MSCSICCEEEGDAFYTLECGHSFHIGCIVKWFRQCGTCPNCRDDMKQCIPKWSLHERSKYARRAAYRKNAPKKLKQMVNKLSKVEQEEKNIAETARELDNKYREVFKTKAALRRRKWAIVRKKRELKNALGLFEFEGFKLPVLTVSRTPAF